MRNDEIQPAQQNMYLCAMQAWIPHFRYFIPVSGTWILDSNRQWDSGFIKLFFGYQSPGFRVPKAQISKIPESGFPYRGRFSSSTRECKIKDFMLYGLIILDYLLFVSSPRSVTTLLLALLQACSTEFTFPTKVSVSHSLQVRHPTEAKDKQQLPITDRVKQRLQYNQISVLVSVDYLL